MPVTGMKGESEAERNQRSHIDQHGIHNAAEQITAAQIGDGENHREYVRLPHDSVSEQHAVTPDRDTDKRGGPEQEQDAFFQAVPDTFPVAFHVHNISGIHASACEGRLQCACGFFSHKRNHQKEQGHTEKGKNFQPRRKKKQERRQRNQTQNHLKKQEIKQF